MVDRTASCRPWILAAPVLMIPAAQVLFSNWPSALTPLPIHLWVLSLGGKPLVVLGILLAPLPYFLSMRMLPRPRLFAGVVLAVVAALAALNTLQFLADWEVAIKYHSAAYRDAVLLENVVCAVAAGSAAGLALLRGSQHLCCLASFLTSFWAAWCCFPHLGEML